LVEAARVAARENQMAASTGGVPTKQNAAGGFHLYLFSL
jgi:hypothetical protein